MPYFVVPNEFQLITQSRKKLEIIIQHLIHSWDMDSRGI
jgi:hypothetical protein